MRTVQTVFVIIKLNWLITIIAIIISISIIITISQEL